MKTKAITLAYCEKLFKKHKVMGGEAQGTHDGRSHVEITPQVVMDILQNAEDNTRIGVCHETDDEWWDHSGNAYYERWSLQGSVFDDETYLEKMAVRGVDDEGCYAPFYYDEDSAHQDSSALNAIIKEHLGIKPRSKPEFTSEAFVSKATLELNSSFCPACGLNENQGMKKTVCKGPVLTVTRRCNCGAQWDVVYNLQGYQDLKMS